MKDLRFTLVTAAALILAAGPGTSYAGYYYEAVTSNEATGQGSGNQVSTVHAWVDGDSAKVEFQQSAQVGLFQAGSYLVTQDAGAMLFLVNPEQMTITMLDFDQIVGMAGTMMEAMGGVVNMEFSDFSNEKVSEISGESILGFPTTLAHYRTGYTMSISVFGFGRESRVDTENRVWCSDELDANGLRVWLRPDRFRTGNDDFDKLIKQQYETMTCLPLRNEVVTTMSGDGDASVTTTTTEVTQLREENVASAVFELPAGYEHVSLMEGIAGAPPEPAEEPEDDSRPSLRDVLRGLGR